MDLLNCVNAALLSVNNYRDVSKTNALQQLCVISIQMVKKKGKEAYSSLCYKHRTATGTHVPYGITQCYLPPGRGDIPAFTPAD